MFRGTPGAWAADLTDRIPEPLKKGFAGVYVWQLLALFLLILLCLVLRRIVVFVAANWMTRGLEKVFPMWGKRIATSLGLPLGNLAAVGLAVVVFPSLGLHVRINIVAGLVFKVLATLSVVWAAYRFVDIIAAYFSDKAAKTDTKLDDQLVPLIRKAAKVFVVIVGVLFILQNLDVDVASLLAGLGIGGLAFALAAKDTVANLFGSIMIFSDRPFQIGDWVVAAGTEGIVEEVGFRSTRIRTFYNSLVSVPNNKIADSVIDNYGKREFRRVYVTLNCTYDTTPEQLQAFCEGIRAIIQNNELTRKDYYEVHFRDFGASSLDVMVYFFLKVPGWSQELQERHRIFLEIMRLARRLGVEFAFPTQTLHLETVRNQTPPHEHVVPTDNELTGTVRKFGPGGELGRPAGPKLTHGFFAGQPLPSGDSSESSSGE
jgi:MscS family membrane protein